MAQSKSKSDTGKEMDQAEVAVVEPEVEETAAEAVAEVVAANVEPIGPTPVPEGFKGTRIPLAEFGNNLSIVAKTTGAALAKVGLTPEDLVIQSNVGNALVLNVAKGGPEQLLYIAPENKNFIIGALANLPQFRARFTQEVMEKIRRGRESAEYQAALVELDARRSAVNAQTATLRAMTGEYAKPFDASLFVDEYSLVDVRPKMAQSNGTIRESNGTTRTRRPSDTRWNLPMYKLPSLVDGIGYSLFNEGNDQWVIRDEGGNEVASGSSANEATRNWYRDRGMSTNISTPAIWGAAAQESAS